MDLSIELLETRDRLHIYLSDTVGGANASANLYSLIEPAKANGIEPYHYLVALFKRLPVAQTVDD